MVTNLGAQWQVAALGPNVQEPAVAGRLMVTLAWGNVLSILLPGLVGLFAVQRFSPFLGGLLTNLRGNEISIASGLFLVLVAALLGGMLEAVRRVTLDRLLPGTEAALYEYVTPANLTLFEAAVENSYKYYSFYGNLAFAFLILVASRLLMHACGPLDLAYLAAAGVLGYAAWVQHQMFIGFANGFIEAERHRRGA